MYIDHGRLRRWCVWSHALVAENRHPIWRCFATIPPTLTMGAHTEAAVFPAGMSHSVKGVVSMFLSPTCGMNTTGQKAANATFAEVIWKINRSCNGDLVKKIFCSTSHGSVAEIAADKMTNKELMDTLLSDARLLASRNISGGKYDACHITKYILDRLCRLEDLQKLAESAANEKLRDLAQSRLSLLQEK